MLSHTVVQFGVLSHKSIISKLFQLSTVGVTLVVNPWTSLDPINVPKMALLVFSVFGLLPWLMVEIASNPKSDLKLFLGLSALAFGLIASLYNSKSQIWQQVWGVWGRNTGVITFFSLLALTLTGYFYSRKGNPEEVIQWLQRCSYFVTFYCFVQLGRIDPIQWSQDATVATLGNINFVSAFLGFANITFIVTLVARDTSVSSKWFHICFLALNLFVILESQSIQGLAITLAGASVILFFYLHSLGLKLLSLLFLTSSICLGVAAFLATAGIGPLGQRLRQDSVLFRTDYWDAGWRMLLANPIFGLGMDSYGDFYREFRSDLAVTRTGPGRVSNTAHNIFLDWGSGGGFFVLLPMIFIIFLAIYRVLRNVIASPLHSLGLEVLSVLFGWLVFLSISINQIGVAVWGFALLGVALSFPGVDSGGHSSTSSFSPHSKTVKVSDKLKSNAAVVVTPKAERQKIAIVVCSAILGSFLVVAPVKSDSQFLRIFRSGDLKKGEALVTQMGVTSFHLEKLISEYIEVNDQESALRVARVLVRQHPRNFWGWSIIALNPGSTSVEKMKAKKTLLKLDPKNSSARNALEDIGDK